MNKLLLVLFLMCASCNVTFAQSIEVESVKPTTDTEVVRRCAFLDIEGKTYYNVVVTMKSTTPDYFITDKYKVKFVVKSEDGKTVYKKTFKGAYLYIFSNGQIQIGKPRFNQVIIRKDTDTNQVYGIVREKEGIF